MYTMFTSTIAAVSTPHGKGGIAVIRISGPDAFPICEKFIRPKNGERISQIKSHTASLSLILDASGETLDEAIVIVYRAPHSYTGEDTVEINCHGGILLTEMILARTLACGAVTAGPGEFTRRAFSAGKLSLSEAEAVIGVIEAQTRTALKLSRSNLDGNIHKKTDAAYELLGTLVSSVYAEVDFPDEDLSGMTHEDLRAGILEVRRMLETLYSSYQAGHAVCEGIRTVIFGKPNTGKSTLLNLLAEEDRAIVTDIAGTTRDVIRETVTAGDVILRLSDTAGIREGTDEAEKIGVSKSIAALEEAELILVVFDASAPLDTQDMRVLEHVRRKAESAQIIALLNKSDLPIEIEEAVIEEMLGVSPIRICAKNTESRQILVSAIETIWKTGELTQSDNAVITNARQFAAISDALSHIQDALTALDTLGADIACTELESAMASLGELDGRQVTEDVVDRIFHRFCVGK